MRRSALTDAPTVSVTNQRWTKTRTKRSVGRRACCAACQRDHAQVVSVDGRDVALTLLDVAGVDEHAAYRDQDYRAADGFLMVHDLSSGDSFRQLRSVVARQIAAAKGADMLRSRQLPLVVVGAKSDIASVDSSASFSLARKNLIAAFCSRRANVGASAGRAVRRVFGQKRQQLRHAV